MPAEVDVAIIGAGVIGLAIAAELAQEDKCIIIFEKNHTFGLETSTRNSEIVHTGIYYPEDSLKANLCIEGKNLLYEICDRHGIGYKKLGKIIVAVNENEVKELERIYRQGERNGVEDLTLLSREELKKLEPNIEGRAGLLSPSTSVLDVYSLMKLFYSQAKGKGVEIVFNTEVIGIENAGNRHRVQINDREGISSFIAGIVVNSTGLNSDKIAKLAGIDIAQVGYKLYYCKGEYFSLNSNRRHFVERLIYPIPGQAGLGIHINLGLDGRMRLGPNAHYIDEIDYSIDGSQKNAFYEFAKRFLPLIELEDLEPDSAGIRPKLQSPSEVFRDFIISHEDKIGFPGLINLIGIESPGLTASPAIARYVARIIKELK